MLEIRERDALFTAGAATPAVTPLAADAPAVTSTVGISPGPLIPPQTPTGLSPGTTVPPGPTLSSATVTFSWNAAAGANQYNLAVYDDTTGTLALNVWVNPGLAVTAKTVSYSTTLAPSHQYSWQVNACIRDNKWFPSGHCSNDSPIYYFTTPAAAAGTPPATPTGLTPGSATAPGPTTSDKTVTLSWSASPSATAYTVQVTDTATGAQVINVSTGSPAYTASLNYASSYRWTVNACNSAGCSADAAPDYFQTPANPTPPVETHTDYLDLAGAPLAEIANGNPTYLHPDLLGSPRLATGPGQQIRWREHYEPYGQKLNGVNEKVGYTGAAYDAESGLTYLQARFYDAQVGRFLSTDPLPFTGDPFSFNRYAYAKDNPYRYTDPTGRCPPQVCQGGDYNLEGFNTISVEGTRIGAARGSIGVPIVQPTAAATGNTGNHLTSGMSGHNTQASASSGSKGGDTLTSVKDALDAAGVGLGLVENSGSKITIGSNLRIYTKGFFGNQYVGILRLTKGAHYLGEIGFFVSTAIEARGVRTGAVSPGEFGVDTAVGAIGLSGPTGFAFATTYFILRSAPPTPLPFMGEPCMEAQICGPPYSGNP